MYPPVDYPVSDVEQPADSDAKMTYASLLERHSAAKHITDAMIQSASLGMETAQQVPAVAKPQTVKQIPTTAIMQRLIEVIR